MPEKAILTILESAQLRSDNELISVVQRSLDQQFMGLSNGTFLHKEERLGPAHIESLQDRILDRIMALRRAASSIEALRPSGE